jgi:hypothetical protein
VLPPQQLPQTGAEDGRPVTPSEAQAIKQLEAMTSQSLEGLTFEQRADGTIGIDLQGRFMHVMRAHPGEHGSEVSCRVGENDADTLAAIQAFQPHRGSAVQRLDVSALRALLPLIVKKPAVLEVK